MTTHFHLFVRSPVDELLQAMRQLAVSGLERDICCTPFAQVAHLCRISVCKATRHVELHRISIVEGGGYSAAVSEIACEALAATIPNGR